MEEFGAAVGASKAVIARSLGQIENLLESDRTIYTSFHQQVAEGARIPEDNVYDNRRAAVDAWLFPHFHSEIRFGCLSLGNGGLSGYGSYHLVLKDALVERRATVFEENPFRFIERHRLITTAPIPPGYRATWDKRGLLAMAKLHGELTSSFQAQDFQELLLRDDGTTGTSDFIEVHIYGPFTRDTVEKVIGPRPQTREDRVIWARLERSLPKHGISVETM